MPPFWIMIAVLALATAGFLLGRSRSIRMVEGNTRVLHSRPTYHGWNVVLFTAIPALLLLAVARFLEGPGWLMWAALALALAGLAFSLSRVAPEFRARDAVERIVRGILIVCSLIAIATTVGIVLSLVFESARFFQMYPWQDFFFGTEWTPSFGGGSRLGMLPLLWGTLYISFIALLVAVPIGLYAAIYMSEYATPRVRSVVKPAIEVLAGIPTIVYGLFALVTVGPLLRDWIAQPLGLGNSGSSVMTAGLVMGMMLIPFVSSLSDDIINAVPQSLRDGSLALGSTPSETIRQVVVPAALPGIVGAVLLAASRAIGETMIVVLGAGAMARMDLNPFEAMTTITVKIVGQLTGDNDFASPETLVAFALGLTLFVMTLGLNVLALYIVRKYREQYE
ncbi:MULTISPECIES: phosphate ABC transporter permease subunit PstC [unclassified Paracoccus (in: a-proteobacteria)]|uniref:phosphate ABC transporter permease subunit PstC n=1 Tax=unclassified Paracoccus (in: a-proteobacteria) TaxID=2688777 RepID=UPI001604998D|nr:MULTISPECIES: phosphate ABC transporter permease subunit PstC [unclassified Paracoccus (in: a-proteobacteria)]MBB1490114.1 phosphate ABC transporter permease subunit PstC [Paracoccus sp. MC1854]MBB1496702.1 phosphate ABC transporter permease subunit PstC [Paracoccus sp. MC1862]QQO43711.1 phosphate ABC transporter permease subunit PstC [Paracoccus sp. MC1862]